MIQLLNHRDCDPVFRPVYRGNRRTARSSTGVAKNSRIPEKAGRFFKRQRYPHFRGRRGNIADRTRIRSGSRRGRQRHAGQMGRRQQRRTRNNGSKWKISSISDKKWDRQPAAYNHQNRTIFISARVLKDPGWEAVLKHEINHAIDLTLQGDSRLTAKWKAYINKLYNAARRQGTIAFDELDPHEYFARIDLS